MLHGFEHDFKSDLVASDRGQTRITADVSIPTMISVLRNPHCQEPIQEIRRLVTAGRKFRRTIPRLEKRRRRTISRRNSRGTRSYENKVRKNKDHQKEEE